MVIEMRRIFIYELCKLIEKEVNFWDDENEFLFVFVLRWIYLLIVIELYIICRFCFNNKNIKNFFFSFMVILWDGFNNRLYVVENRISEFKEMLIENI